MSILSKSAKYIGLAAIVGAAALFSGCDNRDPRDQWGNGKPATEQVQATPEEKPPVNLSRQPVQYSENHKNKIENVIDGKQYLLVETDRTAGTNAIARYSMLQITKKGATQDRDETSTYWDSFGQGILGLVDGDYYSFSIGYGEGSKGTTIRPSEVISDLKGEFKTYRLNESSVADRIVAQAKNDLATKYTSEYQEGINSIVKYNAGIFQAHTRLPINTVNAHYDFKAGSDSTADTFTLTMPAFQSKDMKDGHDGEVYVFTDFNRDGIIGNHEKDGFYWSRGQSEGSEFVSINPNEAFYNLNILGTNTENTFRSGSEPVSDKVLKYSQDLLNGIITKNYKMLLDKYVQQEASALNLN